MMSFSRTTGTRFSTTNSIFAGPLATTAVPISTFSLGLSVNLSGMTVSHGRAREDCHKDVSLYLIHFPPEDEQRWKPARVYAPDVSQSGGVHARQESLMHSQRADSATD